MSTILPSATIGFPASRFFPTSLWRMLRTYSEELTRALAAAHRYEQLRSRRG